MGNKKISELPVTTTLTDNDIIPVVNTDGTKKVSVDTLQNKVKTKYNIPNDVNAALSTLQPKSDNSLSSLDAQGRVVQSILAVDEHEQQDRVAIDNRIKKFYTSNLQAESVNDSDDGAIRNLKLYGKGSQQSYTGKNLFNETIINHTKLGITFSYVSGGGVKVNGTSTGTANSNKYNATLGAGTYIISRSNNLCTIYVQVGDVYYYHGQTFTLTESTAVQMFLQVPTGRTLDNIVIYFQVELGTTATSFEPYVGGIPSPNPSYPQTIHSVVNPKMDVGTHKYISKIDGCNISSSGYIEQNESSAQYTMCVFRIKEGQSVDGYVYGYFQNIPQVGQRAIDNTRHVSEVTVAPSNANYVIVRVENAVRQAVNYTINGFTYSLVGASVYAEECESHTATLAKTLNAIPVSSGGNVTIDGQQYIADYVDVERKKLVRRILSFNAKTKVWRKLTSNSYVYVIGRYYTYIGIDYRTTKLVLSNRYLGHIYQDTSVRTDKTIYAYNGSDGATVAIYDNSITSLADFNAYINANDVWVTVVASNPTEESLTDAEVADFLAMRSYYPQTNYSLTSDDLSSKAEFIYPCSIEGFVEYVKTQQGDTRTFIYNIDDVADRAYIDSQYALALLELS